MASPLTDAHIRGQEKLRRVTVRAVESIWRDLPGYDRENVDEWLSKVVPVALSAQRTSVALTEAFLARALRRQPLGLNPDDLIGAGARNGTPPETVYERPFVTLWTALGAGTLHDDALNAALARATSTAAMDVQLAFRATANAADEQTNGYGYRRVANPNACAFCLEVDGAYVKGEGYAMALHNHCGCGLEPLTEPHRRAVHLPDGTRIREYQHGPLNDSVAVHQHGELGAVLGAPEHNFTGPSDL